MPVQEAKRLRSANLATSPTSARIWAATTGPTPGRVHQDEFALRSQQRAATEAARAAFVEEIVPVENGGRRPRTVAVDEHPKPETTLEGLAGLRPAFTKDGTVTAGNASGINNGGGAVVLARESVAAERGLTGLVTLEAVATAAMEPELMGYAPTLALKKLFEQTGTSPADIDIIELNEAFASQAVAVIRDAALDPSVSTPTAARSRWATRSARRARSSRSGSRRTCVAPTRSWES